MVQVLPPLITGVLPSLPSLPQFDTGIVNSFQAMQGFLKVFGHFNPATQKFAIDTVFQQLITSLLQVGLITASIIIGPFSKFFGRRAGFAACSVVSFIAITIQVLVTSKGPIYVGRLLLGIANGGYVNLLVLYNSETAPSHLRGSYVSAFQPAVGLGGIIGGVISKALSTNLTKHSYQIQLAILYVVPVFLLIYSFFLPESPRWLAVQGRDDDAGKALRYIRGNSSTPEQVTIELEAIKANIILERELQKDVKILDIFRGTDLRRTLLACGATTLHASSGINFLVGYATVFFQVASPGSNAFTNTIILQCCGLAGALTAPFLARYFGRKTILLFGFGTTTIAMFTVAIVYTIAPKSSAGGKALIAMVCCYQAAYNFSVGPLAWVVAAEFPSNRLRSVTFGFSMAVGFVFAWLTVFTTPYFIGVQELNLGAKVAWIWGPSNLISFLWILIFLPDTFGRTLEEIDEMFIQRVPGRKFRSYVIKGIAVEHSPAEQFEKAETGSFRE
ncbi:general substrate transporter [Leucosporidium creatinivorum]|uniref:General substrate transporter n=1 Tax=Leucosporidium creatinivorum TaxID=106004 RepID=A0A1Y2FXT1_9BASI|nr:general substrate transporter [Leucosporidium creatinivorum]